MASTHSYQPTDLNGAPLGKPRHRAVVDDGTDDTEVPNGSIADLQEWVGYDPDRAKAALLREHAAETPRKGLIAALERVVKEG